jgi:ABC-2 type transport system ATP-binding protein
MEETLVAADVRKAYGDVVALDGVSLSVAGGEVFGLIGPNGAGKTTLVRAFTGTTPVEGTVEVLGAPPGAVDPHRIGLLPQSFAPAARLTARELLAYYAGLYDEGRARDPETVLADVGLAADADRRYEALSGGQRRRLCVGAALVNDPDVLFLDEPTTGIDPAGRRSLWGLIDDLAAGGTTVLLTSHSMREVERLADRVGLLADGRVVATGSPAALVDEYGGDARLVVEVDPEAGEAGPASVEAVRAVAPELDVVAGDDDGREAADMVVRGLAAEDIGRAVAALDEAGVGYEGLTWRQPGLEDVYLSLTGEQFDGAVAGTGPAAPVPTAGGASDGGERSSAGANPEEAQP